MIFKFLILTNRRKCQQKAVGGMLTANIVPTAVGDKLSEIFV
jgi:hypothetical protein